MLFRTCFFACWGCACLAGGFPLRAQSGTEPVLAAVRTIPAPAQEVPADALAALRDQEIAEIRRLQGIATGVTLGFCALILPLLVLLHSQRRQNRDMAALLQNAQQEISRLQQDLHYAGTLLAGKNHLLLHLRELVDQNAAGNPRKLREDLRAIIACIQADLAPQPAAGQGETAPAAPPQLEILLPGFMERLHQQCPSLSRNDLRLAACIRLGYSSRDIAGLLNTEQNTVEVARHRLRKKLALPPEVLLTTYVQGI